MPRVGAKAYEQCAGFLRVSGSSEILDCTGVHPESYGIAKALLNRFSLNEDDVRQGRIIGLRETVAQAGTGKIAAELGVGIPTLEDIISELEKPGRDAVSYTHLLSTCVLYPFGSSLTKLFSPADEHTMSRRSLLYLLAKTIFSPSVI